MGMYLNLATAVLQPKEDGFVQQNQVFYFEEEVYVAWCHAPREVASPGWSMVAAETLRIQRPAEYLHPGAEFRTEPVYPEDEPGRFTYAERFDLGGGDPGLFHLVMPPGYLPLGDSFQPRPTYARPQGDRFVMGWIWQPGIWFRFEFEAVSPDDFTRKAKRLQRRLIQDQAASPEPETDYLSDYLSIETQLRTWVGNRQFLEEQVANFGLQVPLHIHNELENAKAQIARLENRRANLQGYR